MRFLNWVTDVEPTKAIPAQADPEWGGSSHTIDQTLPILDGFSLEDYSLMDSKKVLSLYLGTQAILKAVFRFK